MQNTILLQFDNLTNLATFIKAVHPGAYVVNTMRLTVMAAFNAFEVAVALEQYNGVVASQTAEAAYPE